MPDPAARRSLAAAIAVSIVLSLVFIARTAFMAGGERYFTLFDDAMISMRYARNLAAGHGLVWNAGQPGVEGYTNLLWTLWMAVLHLVPVGEPTVPLLVMVTGAAILVIHLLVVHRIAAHMAPASPRTASIAVWLVALYYPLVFWTLRGMEVGFVTLTISSSVLLALRLADRFHAWELALLSALIVCGVLTRPDMVVPSAVIAIFAVRTARAADRSTVAVALFGALAATFVAHTAFRFFYYGDALPNTYYLKVSGAAPAERLARGLRGLLAVGVLHLFVPLVLAGGYVLARARAPQVRRAATLLASLFLVACAYSVYVGGDAWESMLYANRYITPAVPGLLVLTALAIDAVVQTAGTSRRVVLASAGIFVVGTAIAVISPAVTQGLSATAMDERLRIVRAVMVASPVVVLPVAARARRAAMSLVTIGTLVSVNGFAFGLWLQHNAFYVKEDAWAARYGLALRAASSDDTTIAVSWAGAIPYFSHLSTVDLLGKSDRVIAKGKPQPGAGFDPGHDKWDYAYSIGQLRPDIVAQLWHSTDADASAIEGFGYRRLAPWVFVRATADRVDTSAVQRIACTILADDPFVLGSATNVLQNREAVLHRYCRE